MTDGVWPRGGGGYAGFVGGGGNGHLVCLSGVAPLRE
jgi:hypothetical protein